VAVPLVTAAVCPYPPVLVPEVAAGAAGELADLRAACDAALARIVAAGARQVIVLGPGQEERTYDPPLCGSFRRWGVSMEVTIGGADPGSDREALPPSLTIGAWLLRRVLAVDATDRADDDQSDHQGHRDQPSSVPGGPPTPRVRMVTVREDATPAECAALAQRLSDGDDGEPWALLVLGDGSACRGEKAPGYDDPRAVPFDDQVAAVLANVDLDALSALDPELARDLKVGGRAPWQVLAAAVRATGERWRGELLHYTAPYGVGYFVAVWEPDRGHEP
jgi:hypothetical protein